MNTWEKGDVAVYTNQDLDTKEVWFSISKPSTRNYNYTRRDLIDLHSLLSEILSQHEKKKNVHDGCCKKWCCPACDTGKSCMDDCGCPCHQEKPQEDCGCLNPNDCFHSGSQEPQEEKKCPQKQCWVCDRNEPPKEPSIIPYEEGMPVDSQAGLVNEPCHQEKPQEEKLHSERTESIYLNKVEEEKPDNPSGLGKVWMYIGSIGEFLYEQSKKNK